MTESSVSGSIIKGSISLNADAQPVYDPYRVTISCVLLGHDYTHEMQVISQVFFPCARFSFCGKVPNKGIAVVGKYHGGAFEGEMYNNGQKISGTILRIEDEAEKAAKRTLMLAVFFALKEATGMPTPWGALTGVRPAKQVRLWLEEGIEPIVIIDRLSRVYGLRDDKIQLAMDVAVAEQSLVKKIKELNNDERKTDTSETDTSKSNALYVGIPFCPSRCLYCSFVVSHKPKPDAHKRFLDALEVDINKISGVKNKTGCNIIYVGGGTPTALSEGDLKRLLEILNPFISNMKSGDMKNSVMKNSDTKNNVYTAEYQSEYQSEFQSEYQNEYQHECIVDKFIEYTVEAGRPDSITHEKLKLLKEYGVTRIAINPQTLNDATLTQIGRAHTSADFFKAYEMALHAGFDNINTDIIVGLPGEGPDDIRHTMDGLKKLAPAHVTVHTLAVKRASRLNEHRMDNLMMHGYNQYCDIAQFDMIDSMLCIAREACEEMGLSPYYMYRQKNMVGHFENVGYSLPGYECLYNVAMMAEVQTVVGIGAGAVTKIVENSLIRREFKPKDVETYIRQMFEE